MNEQVQEKVSRAQNILKALDVNLSIAIAANAMFNTAAYNEAITKCFDQTVAAWGFNEVLCSEQLNLIMSLIRIYDTRRGVHSLPRLMEIIAEQDVRGAFRNDAASRASDHEPYFIRPEMLSAEDKHWLVEDARNSRRVSNVKNFEKYSQRACEIYDELRGSHILGSLRQYRHQVLAHTTPTDTVNPSPKNDFAEKLLERTVELVTALQLALTGGHLDYEGSMEVWNQKASAFWDKAARGMPTQ